MPAVCSSQPPAPAPRRRRSKLASSGPWRGWKAERSPWTRARRRPCRSCSPIPRRAPQSLPIVAKWDKAGTLTASAESRARALLGDLGNAATSDDRRVDIAASLLAIPQRRQEALATIGPMLTDSACAGTAERPADRRDRREPGQRRGRRADRGARADQLDAHLRPAPEAPGALARAAGRDEGRESHAGEPRTGQRRAAPHAPEPAGGAAGRRAPRHAVARDEGRRASSSRRWRRKSRSPATPTTAGVLFTGACSSCHKLGDVGKSQAGPPLDGIGAHGRAELLTHIIDPNREVDPSFWQWNVTTRKGETLAGVVASENAAGLTLRNAAGDVEIKREDISTRENTRRSLMPEGLEALGAEALRDILSFMGGNAGAFRVVDLRQAYTADTRRGFRREEERDDTVTLHKFGDVSVAGVPFFVMDPAQIAERREPGGAQGRTRQRESLGRFPAARRDSDVGHRGEPALPGRGRRLGVADRGRRGSRQAGDEGHGPLRRRHERGARAQERRAHRRHVRPGGRAAQRRRRRFHAPGTAALLRAESRQEGDAVEDRAGELRHRRRAGHGRHHGRRRACSGQVLFRRDGGSGRRGRGREARQARRRADAATPRCRK